MDEQIKSLRQQVAAAEFLLHSLQTQLKEAEERVAANAQQQQRANNVGSAPRHSGANNIPASRRGGNEGESALDPGLTLYEQPVSRTDVHGVIGAAGEGEEASPDVDDDAPGENIDDSAQVFQLPSLEIGLTYSSLEDVKRAAIAHAISQGWTCGVDKRDKTRLLLKCRSAAACPFHLRAEQYENGARIASYKPEHSCEFKPDQSHIPRGHATSVRFLREQLPTFMTVDENTTAQEISDAIFHRFGTRVSLKQCRSLRTAPKRKRKPSLGTCGTCGEFPLTRTLPPSLLRCLYQR
jgi:hypothetical protein